MSIQATLQCQTRSGKDLRKEKYLIYWYKQVLCVIVLFTPENQRALIEIWYDIT